MLTGTAHCLCWSKAGKCSQELPQSVLLYLCQCLKAVGNLSVGKGTVCMSLTVCPISWFHVRSVAAPPSVRSVWFPVFTVAVFGRQSLWLCFLSSSVALADEARLLLFSQASAFSQLLNTLTEPTVSTRTWARHWSWFNVKRDHVLQAVHRQLLRHLTNTGAWAALTNSRWFCLVISENDEEQEALLSLDKPGWYSQGNAIQLYELLKKMTGKLDPKVCLYVLSESKSFWKYLVSV